MEGDSGIEDTETLESSCDDMDSLVFKREHNPKEFEGFLTGDANFDASKGNSKIKVNGGSGDKKTKEADYHNRKSEKENVPAAGEVFDVVVNRTRKRAKRNLAKQSWKTNPSNSNGGSVPCEAEVVNIDAINCEMETVNHERYDPERRSGRKYPDSDKIATKTVKSNADETLKPSNRKKAKLDASISNASNVNETSKDTFTKIKNHKLVSESKVNDLESKECDTVSATEADRINNNITYRLIDLNKPKRDLKDRYCSVCKEINGDLIVCNGTCLNQFHQNCLGSNFVATTDNFICDECSTGYHSCFVCHQKTDNVVKCSQSTCGKYYHVQCLESNTCSRFENKAKNKFTCPHHVCKSCNINKDQTFKMTGRRVIKCVQCPNAYHHNLCLPAGCLPLTVNRMVCDDHFNPTKNGVHFNTTWCIVCSFGGSLVCCETCPASFHVECSDELSDVPEVAWRCSDCCNGNKVRYGDIVWVKFSKYRWWPGRICLPEDVPANIQKLHHTVGEFPVFFFGSHDYAWLRPHRVFKYAEGDTGGRGKKNYLEKYFSKALDEAKEAFIEREKIKEECIQALDKKQQSNKPPPYKHIKVNKPVTCIRVGLDRSEWPICQCGAHDPCKNECLNKMLYYECNSKLCPNKEKCKNQRIQKWEYVKTTMFRCEEKGWGLKADQEIKSGDFVMEYIGELIDEATCRLRIQQYHGRDIYDYYFLTIDKDNIIDAYPRGNLSRFINHSCDPNCETQKWTVNGEIRVGLFTTRGIVVGEELSFNYNLDCLGNEKKKCKCGSANCSGYLGVQPKAQHSIYVSEKSKKKMTVKHKKKQVKQIKVVHEDECFTCGEGGELICCDRNQCSKTYHQYCLMMEKTPRGKWQCPWHFCDECGKLARSMCSLCPNSFCENHLDVQMIELKHDVLVCPVHKQEEMEALKEEAKKSNINAINETVPKQRKTPERKSKNSNKNSSVRNTSLKKL